MRIGCVIFLSIIFFISTERLFAEGLIYYGKALLDGSEEYEKPSAALSPSERIILTYDEQAIDGLYEILTDERNASLWKGSFYAIGIIGSVDQEAADTESLLTITKNLEEMAKIEQNGTGRMFDLTHSLHLAYLAIGRQSHKVWKPFFDERLNGFWGEELPRLEYRYSDGSETSSTPYDSMISGAMTLGEPEALKWAQELLQNHPYLKNSPIAIRRFRHFAGTGKDYKGMDINQASHLRNLEAYDKRLGIPKELPDLPRVETVQPVESDPHTNPRIPEVADDPQQTQQDRNSYASYIGITLFSACVAFLIFRKRVL